MSIIEIIKFVGIAGVIGAVIYAGIRSNKRHEKTLDDLSRKEIEVTNDHSEEGHGPINAVVITDIKMPFESMVIFMIKWALAAIPAAIILGIIFFLAMAMIGHL